MEISLSTTRTWRIFRGGRHSAIHRRFEGMNSITARGDALVPISASSAPATRSRYA